MARERAFVLGANFAAATCISILGVRYCTLALFARSATYLLSFVILLEPPKYPIDAVFIFFRQIFSYLTASYFILRQIRTAVSSSYLQQKRKISKVRIIKVYRHFSVLIVHKKLYRNIFRIEFGDTFRRMKYSIYIF